MINISYPKVTTKPPIHKSTTKKISNKNGVSNSPRKDKSKNCTENKCNDSAEEVHFASDLTIGTMLSSFEKNMKHSATNDCNQNVIEPNSCSFEELCSMISDLEKNEISEPQIVTIGSCFLPKEIKNSDIKYVDQIEPERDESRPCAATAAASTYNDIINFLETLEQNCTISCDPLDPPEVNELQVLMTRSQTEVIQNDKTKDDLATALLQLEDREATLQMLKAELKAERKAACDKLEHQQKDHAVELQAQKTKYQTVIKRHQKFIEQLIEEKKQLNEKYDSLGQKIKEMEAKHHREIKVAVERHSLEVQRAKELCLASEKIRRERWLEAKTSKIKQMTVKGLEPELRSMVDQHQQEIQDIRSTHMKELQDVELRAIRRSNQQLEQLRLELTASHDKILINEKEAMRLRYQEKFDEQEALFQSQQRKFFDDIQLEKKKFADEQSRKDADRDAALHQAAFQFQEKLESLTRQFEFEKKSLKVTFEAERETWIENFKRQQATKFQMAEARIRDESNRERDRQIELAISRLEKESRDIKMSLQRSSDNQLQCLKDKYETDLQMYKENEKSMKEKLELINEKFDQLGTEHHKTENKLGRCLADLNEANRLIEKLTRERDHGRQIARQEIECEKRELEEKIASLYKEINQINANKDTHMAQLYSRIKLIITQKDIAIKGITKEANNFQNKCDHLEKMLDQQRKEYVLKSL